MGYPQESRAARILDKLEAAQKDVKALKEDHEKEFSERPIEQRLNAEIADCFEGVNDALEQAELEIDSAINALHVALENL